jgi:hypothetical protein
MQTFETPPPGFDPQTADAPLLRKYGFPRRPDAAKEPELMRLWQRAFRRAPQLRMVQAELETDQILSKRLAKIRFSPNLQAGAVLPPPGRSESINLVFSEWQIPQVFPPTVNPLTPAVVSFWVGIADASGNPPVSSLLQAGIAAATGVGNETIYWAWTEWWTSEYLTPSKKIAKFPVQPGQVVSVLVCAPQPNVGFVSMLNTTTGQAVSIGVPAPGPDITVGGAAQWTVEQASGALPDFSPVVFGSCIAGTPSVSLNLSSPGAGAENITDSNGSPLTSSVISPQLSAVTVSWEASM